MKSKGLRIYLHTYTVKPRKIDNKFLIGDASFSLQFLVYKFSLPILSINKNKTIVHFTELVDKKS